MTLSLAAVFIPVLFMGGIVGRLLHEFAVTIGVAILVSGFVSISLTPMLCSRFLKPPHAQQHGVLLQRRPSGCSTRGCGSTTGRCALQPALPRRDDGGLAGAARRHGLSVHASSRRASCRARIRAASTSAPRRCRASASTRWSGTSSEVADIVAKDPEHRRLHAATSASGRRRRRRHQHRAHHRRPEAARRADAVGRSDHRRAAAEAGAGARHPRVHGQPAADQPRRPAGRAQPVSVHAAGHRHRRAVPVGAGPRGRRCAQLPGHRGRQQRPAAQEPAGPDRHGPRQDLGARPDRRTRSRPRSTTRTARGRSRRSTRRTISTRSSCRSRRSSSRIRRRCRCCTCARRPASSIPLDTRGEGDDRRRTARPSATPASCRR